MPPHSPLPGNPSSVRSCKDLDAYGVQVIVAVRVLPQEDKKDLQQQLKRVLGLHFNGSAETC